MKFVVTKHIRAFHFFQKERDDGEEYTYLQSMYQVRGLREINIVLYDGFEEKEELMNELRQYRGYNEIFYELGSES